MKRYSNDKTGVETRRRQMWQSMRILRRFTLNDIMVTATVNYTIAYAFVRLLHRQGVIEKARKHTRRAGDFDTWVLKGNPGPHVPVTRSTV